MFFSAIISVTGKGESGNINHLILLEIKYRKRRLYSIFYLGYKKKKNEFACII